MEAACAENDRLAWASALHVHVSVTMLKAWQGRAMNKRHTHAEHCRAECCAARRGAVGGGRGKRHALVFLLRGPESSF